MAVASLVESTWDRAHNETTEKEPREMISAQWQDIRRSRYTEGRSLEDAVKLGVIHDYGNDEL